MDPLGCKLSHRRRAGPSVGPLDAGYKVGRWNSRPSITSVTACMGRAPARHKVANARRSVFTWRWDRYNGREIPLTLPCLREKEQEGIRRVEGVHTLEVRLPWLPPWQGTMPRHSRLRHRRHGAWACDVHREVLLMSTSSTVSRILAWSGRDERCAAVRN